MKKEIISRITWLFAGALLTLGCDKHTEFGGPFPGTDGVLTVRLKADGLTALSASDTKDSFAKTVDETSIGQVTGYRFLNGVFQEAIPGESVSADGNYQFHAQELSGTLYFVANGDAQMFGTLEPGITSLDDFLHIHATTDAMTRNGLTMTGTLELDEAAGAVTTVLLRRSVARLDIVSQDRGVQVESVVIRGVADRGYVNERSVPEQPAEAQLTDFRKEYTSTLLENASEPLTYLCEQRNESLMAEIIVRFGGGQHRLVASMPSSILRNTVYTLRIHGAGAQLSATVHADDWEAGDSTEALPAYKGLVDVDASVLPGGVRVSPSQDSVYVAYRGGDFRLVLRAEPDAMVEIEGVVRDVAVAVEPVAKTLQPVAAVAVESARRMPGEERAYVYLNIYHGAVYSGRVVIVFEPNPIRIEGLLRLDEHGECDFGKYIDGELGRITIPESKVVRVEFDADEDPWMKLVAEEDGFRLLGGWKPNDPKADGRIQEGRIVIADADGSDTESYSIRRRNWGLPVVEIGDTWWCKYNLRGNVKSFEDQITIQADPVTANGLAEYLQTCSDTELLLLMGDQYQGGNPQGLPLRHDGTAFYYEGMQASGQNFGTLEPTVMAPDGYRIPDYDDYAFFSANNNYNIGGVGVKTYRNAAGQEITVRIAEREARFLGHEYGTVSFYEFNTGADSWVLYGLGHQWNPTAGNISRMMLLLATYGNSANSWVMEGYAQADRPGQNWLKYMNQNSTKTRVIRCVKTPVEYMYD